MCSITVNQPHPWSFHRSSSRHHRHRNRNNINITCTCGYCTTSSQPGHSFYYYPLSSSYPLGGGAGSGSIYNIINNDYYTPTPATSTATPRYRPYSGTNYRDTTTSGNRNVDAIYCYDYHFTPTPPPPYTRTQTQTYAPRPPPRPRCRSCDRHSCRCPGRTSRFGGFSWEDRRWVEDWDMWVYERERDVERFTGGLGLDVDFGGRRERWWRRGLGGLGR